MASGNQAGETALAYPDLSGGALSVLRMERVWAVRPFWLVVDSWSHSFFKIERLPMTLDTE